MVSSQPVSCCPRVKKRAFSLVEMLVTIGVIAIIAAIAVPTISRVVDSAAEKAAQRNAQALAGMASSARAAGSTAIEQAGSKEAAVELLTIGVNGEGQFASETFMVGLEDDSRVKTLKFLQYTEDGTLAFDPSSSDEEAGD